MNDRDKTIHELTRLVHWACTQHELDGRVVTRAAEVLADDLSVMIGARDEPEVARFHQSTLAVLRAPEATVWRGGPARTDRASAAVANALAGSWLELDEGYRPVACHGGLYVLPALLAEAEATGLRCDAMLRSLVIAYELVTRIARAWTQRDLTMQAHGRYAAVGAAAGLALARGLDPEQMLAALGAAVTLIGPAPRNHLQEGVLIRNAWAASGACQGFLALEWSRCGITGSAGAFFDVYSTVLGGTVDADRLTQGLGEGWAIMDGYTKVFACCQHLHAAVQAVLQLGEISPATVESIEVRCHPLAMAFVESQPATTLGAKFSMPHALAATLVLRTGGAGAFAAATLHDPRIATLRDKVSMHPWPGELRPPHDRCARVQVRLANGQVLQSECLSAPGSPGNPLPADAWKAKLHKLASPVYPRMPQILEQIAAGDPARLCQTWTVLAHEMASPARCLTPP